MNLTRRYAMFGLAALGATAAVPVRAATVSRPGTAFGTTVNLSVTAPTIEAAEACIRAGFSEVRRVEAAFNLFDRQSEVSRLNAAGQLENASELMLDILRNSRDTHQQTEGAFDPTVQSLWNLWSRGDLPRPEQVAEAVQGNGLDKITVAGSRVAITNRKAQLTFDGIARGLACDRVAAIIAPMGATEAILDTDVTGFLGAPDARFAIEHPRKPGAALGLLKVSRGFIATSGDYGHAFTPDFVHNHIYDPRTGYSPADLSSVTVIADSGARADALATAFMVMGVERTTAFLKSDPAGALLINKDMQVTNLLKPDQVFVHAV